MDRVCLRIYLCKCLKPSRETLHRIYRTAWKEEDNVQEPGEHTYNTGVVCPAGYYEHHPEKSKCGQDDDKQYGKKRVQCQGLPNIDSGNQCTEKKYEGRNSRCDN